MATGREEGLCVCVCVCVRAEGRKEERLFLVWNLTTPALAVAERNKSSLIINNIILIGKAACIGL
jgi:hypothetical protein